MTKRGFLHAFSLTTRELARIIERTGMQVFNFSRIKNMIMPLGRPRPWLAAHLWCNWRCYGGSTPYRSGGDIKHGEELPSVKFKEVRGTEGIKIYDVAGTDVKVAIAFRIGSKELLEKVNGEAIYHFIEIMGCPGGCVNGG